jgi:hypothetical protein
MAAIATGSVRSRRSALVVVLALALVVTAATSAGASSSRRSKAATRVAAAASAFAKEGSARLEGTVAVESTGGPRAGTRISLPFSGAVDNRTKSGRFSIDMSGLDIPGASGSIDEVVTNGAIYMSVDAFGPSAAEEIGGKHWLKMDLGEFDQLGSQGQQADPTSTLDGLRGVSNDVQDLGAEKVRGADTTHYHAVVDVEKALAKVRPSQRERVRNALSQFGNEKLPIDIWIGRDGVPRRYGLSLDVTKDGQTVHITESFDFFDFGAVVDVHAPPASDVANFSDLLSSAQQRQAS